MKTLRLSLAILSIFTLSLPLNSTAEELTTVKDDIAISSASPSLNCSKASLEVEKFICSNKQMRALDKKMTDLYKELTSNISGAQLKSLESSQQQWLESERNKHKVFNKDSAIQVKQSYINRINILKTKSDNICLKPTPTVFENNDANHSEKQLKKILFKSSSLWGAYVFCETKRLEKISNIDDLYRQTMESKVEDDGFYFAFNNWGYWISERSFWNVSTRDLRISLNRQFVLQSKLLKERTDCSASNIATKTTQESWEKYVKNALSIDESLKKLSDYADYNYSGNYQEQSEFTYDLLNRVKSRNAELYHIDCNAD